MRWGALAGLAILLLVAEAAGRPGGGSSFRSGGSSSSRSSSGSSSRSSSGSSSYRSSSGSSSYRSSSGTSQSSSGSSASSGPTQINYLVRRAEDRPAATATWAPGAAVGPYGPPPPRPAVLPVGPAVSEGESLAFSTIAILGVFAVLAIPMLIVGLIIRAGARRQKGWSTAAPAPAAAAAPPANVRKDLEAIRQADPDFSVILLEDFLYALYAEAQAARGQGATARLAPYLGPAARSVLDGLGAQPVSGVVVGAMRFVRFAAGPRLDLTVEFESNYAETHPAAVRGFYALERWHLVRNPAARSRPPDRVRVFCCPCCGAPLDRLVGATCQYCNRVVDGGSYDWTVERIEILERTERGPMLTGTVEEQGTDLPTVFDAYLPQGLQQLHQKDAGFQEQALFGRVALIFQTMQQAWSSLQWNLARPFLTDNLYEAQSYWIRAYQAQGLRNLTEGARITQIEIVRITMDRWYDAITLRLHATGLDYTIQVADNAVVGGNRQRERRYTEYWTLIRGSGRTGATRTDPACPNCGAPLQIGMTAQCGYCQAKVNSGEFDWVLSRIEQDDVYSG